MKPKILSVIVLCLLLVCAGCRSNPPVPSPDSSGPSAPSDPSSSPSSSTVSSPPSSVVSSPSSKDETSQTTEKPFSPNFVTASPPYGRVTVAIDEKLVGRYEEEGDPNAYFEIRPDGSVEMSLNYLEGYSWFPSDMLWVTAYYYEPSLQCTLLTFHLIQGEYHFPLGQSMSINFESWRADYGKAFCLSFPSAAYSEETVRYIKK